MSRRTPVVRTMLFATAIVVFFLGLAAYGQQSDQLDLLSLSPQKQVPGGTIAIELAYSGQAALNPDTVSVEFDGVAAMVSKVDRASKSILISVVTPSDITAFNAKPTIWVRIGDARLTIRDSFMFELIEPDGEITVAAKSWFERIFDNKNLVAGLGALMALMFVSSGYLIARLRQQKNAEADATTPPANRNVGPEQAQDSDLNAAESAPTYPLPQPPDALRTAVGRGQCVVVVGSGMNALGGLMTWGEILGTVVVNTLDKKNADYYQRELENDRIDPVAESLRTVVGAEELAERTRTLIPRSFQKESPYAQLRPLDIAGVVNLNYDTLAAEALDNPSVLSHVEARRCLDLLSRGERFVLQLNGSVDGDDMLLSNQDIQDAVAKNDSLRELMRLLYYSRTLLFIGVSLEGVQNFFRLVDRSSQESGAHYALIMASNETFDMRARSLTQFGVDVLPFAIADRDRAIPEFLEELQKVPEVATQPDGRSDHRITAIDLVNIGPFVKQRFEFDETWNVLLGDNGVGKSSILKAIAIAVTGKRSSEYADRLLRSGQNAGEIVLHFGQRKYLTTLSRDSEGMVMVESLSGSPYRLEEVLITGFSALRSIGWEIPKDRGQPGAARPTADDILPLLSGDRDPRLQGVKQLILRLHHSIESTGTPEDDRARYKTLWNSLFDVFRELTRGVPIEPGSIDPQLGKIYIETQDGEVPLENLSQGTLSLISWTGALLQRLHEIARRGEDPQKGAAIVLVDEIDAHMHPAWQRTLTKRLGKMFPNAQFIVTSHSPLMVGSLDVDQVYRLARDDDDRVVVERPDYALRGLGAGGLLTSNLFGLETHLDEPTEERLNRKRTLAAKALKGTIMPDEQDELERLDKELGAIDFTRSHRVPPPEEQSLLDEGDVKTPEPPGTQEDKRERLAIIEESLDEIIDDESEAS